MSSKRGSRGLLLQGMSALLGLAVLLGLGTWQIERKAWKEDLIERLSQRVSAVPVPLPPARDWSSLTPQGSEFQRVAVRVEFAPADDALVYTAGSALRDDVKAPGYFVFAPARLPVGGQVVVNRGYVPDRTYDRSTGPQDIVGVLRWPEAPSWFVSDHDASGRVWHVRDPERMARVRNWGPVAPFYIEQEAPVPAGGLPHPSALTVRLRNDHLQYALTWYGLAAVLVAVFGAWAVRRRRDAVSMEHHGIRP